MRFTSFVLSIVLALTVLNCSKKNDLAGPNPGDAAPQGKNPPSVPENPNRELIANILVNGNFLGTACVQWVKLTEAGHENETYMDLSNEACPASGLVAEAKVLTRLQVIQHPTYFTQYRPIDIGTGEYIGVFRKLDNSGTISYRLEGLCDTDTNSYNEDWARSCELVMDGGKLSSSEPLRWYPD